MSWKNWAFIFLSPGFDPENNTQVMQSDFCRLTVVGIDIHEKEKVLNVAKKLVADNVQAIELCGGFGPLWIAKVTEANDSAVPVGSVAYGPEARKQLLQINDQL